MVNWLALFKFPEPPLLLQDQYILAASGSPHSDEDTPIVKEFVLADTPFWVPVDGFLYLLLLVKVGFAGGLPKGIEVTSIDLDALIPVICAFTPALWEDAYPGPLNDPQISHTVPQSDDALYLKSTDTDMFILSTESDGNENVYGPDLDVSILEVRGNLTFILDPSSGRWLLHLTVKNDLPLDHLISSDVNDI